MLALESPTAASVSEVISIVRHFNELEYAAGSVETLQLINHKDGTYTLTRQCGGYLPVIEVARKVSAREVVIVVRALLAW